MKKAKNDSIIQKYVAYKLLILTILFIYQIFTGKFFKSGDSLTNKMVDFFRADKRQNVSCAFDDFVRVSVSNRQQTVCRAVQMPNRKRVLFWFVAPGADHL